MNLYSVILGAGGSIALLRILQLTPAAQRFRWLMAGLFSMVGALIGARIGFVIANHKYFLTHIQDIKNISLGGLSWAGALTGVILFGWLTLILFRLPLLKGFDLLSRMLLPLATAIWLGAWQAGIAFGQLLPASTWWGVMIHDESGLTALRVPVQPAAVVSLLLVLGLCEWLVRYTKKDGLKAGISFFVLSLHSLLFSFMRYDSVQTMLDLRLDTWAAIIFSILSSLFLALVLINNKKPATNQATGSE